MAARIEREVRQTVAARAGDVETLARHVAAEAPLIVAATSSRDQLSDLFDRLVVLSAPVDSHGVAVTIYVPTPDGYRILAWSDGPGESNLAPERLAGPAALFVAPGHAGMRLVFVEPGPTGTRRVAVAVAETVLATVTREPAVPERQLPTSFGPVSVVEQYASAREARPPQNGFVIASDTGAPLLEVRLDPAELAARRLTFRHRFEAVALLPLAAGLALLIGPVVGRRRRERGARGWAIWTGLAVVLLLASAGAFTLLVALGRAPAALRGTVGAAALLGLVTLIPGNLWWRARQRRCPRAAPARFAFEQLAAGLVLAATLEVVARLLGQSITPTVLDTSRFVLFPFDAGGLLALGNVLMVELAAAWAAAAVLATIANRWRLTPRRPAALVALALWLLPVAGLRALPASLAGRAALALLPVVVAGAVFALRAAWIRRRFRHTTQSTRLLLAFAAVLVPLMALYPLSAATADRLTRHVIENDYGPAIAHQPEELRAELARARDAIDALPSLPALVAQVPTVRTGYDSQAAFLVWSQTPLSRSRVISDVELYSEDRALVSRFALNLPEYVYRTTQQNWQATRVRLGRVRGGDPLRRRRTADAPRRARRL